MSSLKDGAGAGLWSRNGVVPVSVLIEGEKWRLQRFSVCAGGNSDGGGGDGGCS